MAQGLRSVLSTPLRAGSRELRTSVKPRATAPCDTPLYQFENVTG